jgi:ABC-type maltose transport system permease subunit
VKCIISLLILLTISITVHSQTDSTHHTDTVHFHYLYSGTGTLNNNNSLHSFILANALKLSLAKKSAEFNWNNNWVYGRQDHLLTNNDFSSTLDMGLFRSVRHFYYWGVATYNHSIPLLINHQGQIGAGPGYNIIDRKKALLSVSDGPLYELNDLYDSLYGLPGGNILRRDRYQTIRNSFHVLAHVTIKDQYTFDLSGFLQNSFKDWQDNIFRINASASIKLYKWLNLTAAYAYSRFTRTRGENTLLTFGLTIQQ